MTIKNLIERIRRKKIKLHGSIALLVTLSCYLAWEAAAGGSKGKQYFL